MCAYGVCDMKWFGQPCTKKCPTNHSYTSSMDGRTVTNCIPMSDRVFRPLQLDLVCVCACCGVPIGRARARSKSMVEGRDERDSSHCARTYDKVSAGERAG